MRETEYSKIIKKENREYEKAKLFSWIRIKTTLNKDKLKTRKFSHSIFRKSHFGSNMKNALPDDNYFKPTDIILYDLIPKEELEATQKGLHKLIKKCATHKFISIGRQQDDIENIINSLDNTINNLKSWYRVDAFDFANNPELDDYINHFEICFRNFSSSYVAVEMQVFLNEKFQNELMQFAKREYVKPGMRVHKIWKTNNNKKSGAKIGYAVSGGDCNEYAKSILIYEQLQYVKKIFLVEIIKYLPLLLYKEGKKLYGINVFETNLECEKEYSNSVINALGMNLYNGFYLSLEEKLFVSTSIKSLEDNYRSDMMFVYNPDKILDCVGYGTPHNMVLAQLTEGYMEEMYSMVIFKEYGLHYLERTCVYRNKVNEKKTNRRSHRKLLKLKYEIEKEFYTYSKIEKELPIEKEAEKVTQILKNNEVSKKSVYYTHHPYLDYAGTPKFIWIQIKTNYSEIKDNLKNKIDISSSLNNYNDSRHNFRIGWIQLLLAISTFVLLVFPDKGVFLSELIVKCIDCIKNIFGI